MVAKTYGGQAVWMGTGLDLGHVLLIFLDMGGKVGGQNLWMDEPYAWAPVHSIETSLDRPSVLRPVNCLTNFLDTGR